MAVTSRTRFETGQRAPKIAQNQDGLLAELADAMDSKSIGPTLKTPAKSGDSQKGADCLRSACADDASELLKLLPKLAPKQRRQLLTLARSVVE